jgi:hypothetical protein
MQSKKIKELVYFLIPAWSCGKKKLQGKELGGSMKLSTLSQ